MTLVPRFLQSVEATIGLLVILMLVAIGVFNPVFWHPESLFALLRNNIVIGIMALGTMTVLVSGGIDVSFTAFAAFGMYAGLRAGYLLAPNSVVLPLAVGATVGLLLGGVNAFLVHKIRIIPLIATLATGSIARGFLLGAIGAKIVNVDQMPPGLIEAGKSNLLTATSPDGSLVGLPTAFAAYMLIAIALHFFLANTLAGRALFAVGCDPEAASRIGISVGRTRFIAYAVAGALAGFAGVVHAAMNWVGEPRAFDMLTLDVLAAAIIGGTSIYGGRGSVAGTLIGVFLLVLINNSLIILGIPTTWQRIVLGGVFIIVTGATYFRRTSE